MMTHSGHNHEVESDCPRWTLARRLIYLLHVREEECCVPIELGKSALLIRMNENIAYFSMEVALEPDVPTYSGGLGVL
jgi:hypothetical protein